MQARPYGAGVPEDGAAFGSMDPKVKIIRQSDVAIYILHLR